MQQANQQEQEAALEVLHKQLEVGHYFCCFCFSVFFIYLLADCTSMCIS